MEVADTPEQGRHAEEQWQEARVGCTRVVWPLDESHARGTAKATTPGKTRNASNARANMCPATPDETSGSDGYRGPVGPRCDRLRYLVFVALLSMSGAHLPSGPCVSILNVYAVGESSLIVTRVLTFLPPIMLSSS